MRQRDGIKRSVRSGIGVLLCLLMIGPPPAASAPLPPPAQPVSPRPHALPAAPGSESTLLMEVSTGEVLQASDPHRRFPPASLDKLMTLYLTLQAIHAGRLTLDTPVTVSTAAWRIGRRPGSSRMFLDRGDVVTVDKLLEGLMVASGNDAAEVLAEAVAGSPERFVEEMNAAAARLEMRDTHFVTPHGLPSPHEYTSAWDTAVVARQILLDDPDIVRFTSPQYATYGGIRQPNWNNLVFRDPRVDGLKTGHTVESGFSIAATAHVGGMRLIAVVMGAPTLRRRTALAEGLLDSGFARYVLQPIPWKGIVPEAVPIYGGRGGRLPLETAHPVAVLLEKAAHQQLEVSEMITVRPFAPVRRGQRVGVLTVRRAGRVVLTSPLVAADTIEPDGLAGRVWGALAYAVGRLVLRRPATWSGMYTPQQ
ncbi:MAG TPA: D-alanyl-D-alanine carboxypeptidase family protein [bacterium]|nr:D-alanyl-D-alanine carboxypeptidase family protein [bacterium]